jgi:hypothetical protein
MNALRHHILLNRHGYRCSGCGIDTFFTNHELMVHMTRCTAAQQFLYPTQDELWCNDLDLRLHQEGMNHFYRLADPMVSVSAKNRRRKRR